VHLGDRCCRQGGGVDRREELLDRAAQFGGYLYQHLFKREAGDIVLQFFKLAHKGLRDDIRPGREDLPQLDKGRTQFLQGQSHPLGGRQPGQIGQRAPEQASAAHHHIGKSQHLEYLVKAVGAEHANYVQIAPDAAYVAVDL